MLTAALVSIIASPTFAQSYDPDLGSGNLVAQVEAPAPQLTARAAYAQVPIDTRVRHVNRHRAVTSPYQASAAATSFGMPGSVMTASRSAAVRECSILAAPYREYTWGNFEIYEYRSCMAQRGQVE